MRVPVRKDDGIARRETHRRLTFHLDEAFTLRDQVEDDDTLGSWLEQRCCRIRTWRLVAPRRRESGVDENRSDEAHDTQGFGERVHQPSPISIRSTIGTEYCTAFGIGEQRQPSSTRACNRTCETPSAEMRTTRRRSLGPA